MEQKIKYKLYISYNHNDLELVSRLAIDLESKGITVLYDRNLIEYGDSWREKLIQGLVDADGFLILLTENSSSSNYVMSELGQARALKKFILPIVYGNIPIPQFINDIQVLFWRNNYEEVIDAVIVAISKNQNLKRSSSDKQKSVDPPEENDNRNYWLFKMKANTWEPQNLKVNDATFFNTHFFGEKRPEYELFNEINIGDHILGFGTDDYQGVFCIMEVTEAVSPNTAQGEGFKMIMRRLMSPLISVQQLKSVIPQLLQVLAKNNKPPELFFHISNEIYHAIIAMENVDFVSNENVFEPFYLTEGNHKATNDQLDFENDINSLATVIALKKVHPPLAIGLFGNWGSGKSFFMEKLSERIGQISELNETNYITNVVQVKFNSWHYSDSNLWASLITQIFESLHEYATKKQIGRDAINAIYKDLNIIGQQLEETQKKLDVNSIRQIAIQEQKATIEESIKQKKETLSIWKDKEFVKIVFSDPYIQQDFDNIKKQFYDERLINNIHEIDEKIAQVDSVIGQINESFTLLKKNHKRKWIWIWVLAVLFAICVWLLLGPFKQRIQGFVHESVVVTSFILAWLTNFTAKLSPYFNKIKAFYKRLKSLKQTIETEKENVRLKEHEEINRLNNDIVNLANQKTELEVKQNEIEEKKVKLENEIKEIGSGKLLANFLAGKTTDDAYVKQLGIISWVRRDFAKLNDLFQKQNAVQDVDKGLALEVKIDRIVLYIDDLDRCNEEVVVKVLEAIHLLLAFPLFVVIVGVDPRWLNNALAEKYKTLFGYKHIKTNEKNKEISDEFIEKNDLLDGVATSYDYLEKIFQIPFALKPINKTGRDKLIKYLIREEMEEVVNTSVQESSNSLAETATINLDDNTTLLNVEQESKLNEGKLKPTSRIKERLIFTPAELTYMQKISSLFGQTPRAINRYVNIYRIIKAHGNLKVIGDFSKEEFMPIMFILGIVVGHSSFAHEFINEILKANNTDNFKQFIAKATFNNEFKESIEPLTADVNSISMGDFKRNVELISRFSFRTLLK